ncbi:MAG: T9SS type A sorting domain-containing protein [Candidatus Cloacimonetes bacterium]|nr:T9SS type A sorting domain-containing protein [Candidatus Cloacimonadota bacterium]
MGKIIIFFGFLFICIQSLFAVIINVPADQPSIQEGLNATSVNDTVLVAEGTYFENIEWPDTDCIVLISEAGATNTIIDGSEQDRVIYIPEACTLTNETVIDGFTIQNGHYSGNGPHPGGGIADYCGLTIRNNIIQNNFAQGLGAGIIEVGGFPIIFNNLIINNTSDDAAGGICVSFCEAIIRNNTIVGNSVDNGSGGGGIVLFWASGTTVIEDNIIANNSADGSELGGGGIYVLNSNYSLDHNDLWGNTPDNYIGCSAGPNSISEEPWFIYNDNGDYFLGQAISLCINAGSQTAIEAGLDNYTTSYEFILDSDQVDLGYHYNPDHFDQNDVDDDSVLPSENLLLSNYPNPFNPSTTISFSLPENIEDAEIIIYNSKGQRIREFYLPSTINSQPSSIHWNGKNDIGKSVSSGVYFYQLKVGTKFIQTRKMILMK